jgi:hypothetical protein
VSGKTAMVNDFVVWAKCSAAFRLCLVAKPIRTVTIARVIIFLMPNFLSWRALRRAPSASSGETVAAGTMSFSLLYFFVDFLMNATPFMAI